MGVSLRSVRIRRFTRLWPLLVCFSPPIQTVSAQSVAEVLYITHAGRVQLLNRQQDSVRCGTILSEEDKIALVDGAQIRIYFFALQTNLKFKSPDTLEIGRYVSFPERVQKNRGDALIEEFTRMHKKYFNPEPLNFAGSRGADQQDIQAIHREFTSHLSKPHFVFLKVPTGVWLSLYEDKDGRPGTLFGRQSLPSSERVAIRAWNGRSLKSGAAYVWTIGESDTGRISVLNKEPSLRIEKNLSLIAGEAIDSIEKCQASMLYLADEGLWAEAYFFLDMGLKSDPRNPMLKNWREVLLDPKIRTYKSFIK